MKKIILMLICVTALSAASAQTYKSNILGLRGGLNLSTLSWNEFDDPAIDRRAKMGWHFGLSDQILLSQTLPFYLETGIYLSNKGGMWSLSDTDPNGINTVVSEQFGMTYLQIPLKLNYHFVLDEFSIEPFIGFHYDLGLWGRSVEKIDVGGEKSKDVGKLYKDDDFKRSDVGISLGVGASWSDFYAAISWERGFLNLSKTNGDTATNNSNFMITVGYNF